MPLFCLFIQSMLLLSNECEFRWRHPICNEMEVSTTFPFHFHLMVTLSGASALLLEFVRRKTVICNSDSSDHSHYWVSKMTSCNHLRRFKNRIDPLWSICFISPGDIYCRSLLSWCGYYSPFANSGSSSFEAAQWRERKKSCWRVTQAVKVKSNNEKRVSLDRRRLPGPPTKQRHRQQHRNSRTAAREAIQSLS